MSSSSLHAARHSTVHAVPQKHPALNLPQPKPNLANAHGQTKHKLAEAEAKARANEHTPTPSNLNEVGQALVAGAPEVAGDYDQIQQVSNSYQQQATTDPEHAQENALQAKVQLANNLPQPNNYAGFDPAVLTDIQPIDTFVGNSTLQMYLQQLTTSRSPNILILAALVFLAAADIDANSLQANTMLLTANSVRQRRLSKLQAAFQTFSEAYPFGLDDKDPNKPITLYEIFYKAYGPDGDSDLAKKLDPLANELKSFKKDGSDITYWDEIFNTPTTNSDPNTSNPVDGSGGKPATGETKEDQFNQLFNGMLIGSINQDLDRVQSGEVSTYQDGKYDGSITGAIVSGIQAGGTAASGIASSQNIIFEQSKQTYQQHLQTAISCIQALAKIADNLTRL